MAEGMYFDNILQIIRLRNLNGLKDLGKNNTDEEPTYANIIFLLID